MARIHRGIARALALIGPAAVVAAASGCATGVSDDRATATGGKTLIFQSTALDPANGGQLVGAAALQPGDILLSAADGLTSTGVRLVTLSPVSHAALYVGDGSVAEAVGSGVRARPIQAVLAEESVVVAFRDPRVTAAQGQAIADFGRKRVGQGYDHLGVVLQAPFSLERRVCELPLVPDLVRDFCIRGIATVQLGAFANDRFFCSQFVLVAYRQAGLPLTDADPRWLSPRDILHMREGDVPSVRIRQTLVYVGHLKFRPPPAAVDQGGMVQ